MLLVLYRQTDRQTYKQKKRSKRRKRDWQSLVRNKIEQGCRGQHWQNIDDSGAPFKPQYLDAVVGTAAWGTAEGTAGKPDG